MSLLSQVSTQSSIQYTTKHGINIERIIKSVNPSIFDHLLQQLNNSKGVLFSSSYEYPGRYTRWDIGVSNPPVEIRSKGNKFCIEALNERGVAILKILIEKLQLPTEININFDEVNYLIEGTISNNHVRAFSEEERTKQPSIFTVLRAIIDIFNSPEDTFLGLYGAFGYDLIFQFEKIDEIIDRNGVKNDLVLYIPDEITVIDHKLSAAYTFSYTYALGQTTTVSLSSTPFKSYPPLKKEQPGPAYQKGKYAELVKKAMSSFAVGDLFEVVPTHALYEQCYGSATDIFSRLKLINPSPYGFIVNLGDNEFLVGSSPEMYVRVEGNRIETCPISGTIKRGRDAIEDADQIKKLLNSEKDDSELLMCTDVDRNDKSRICIPGSVRVIGHRQIELYSHLIHTVDHVEGILCPEYDAIDAFITHMWAVTITGAPKRSAIQWIEEHEEIPREYYGGAVGYLGFNGDINTGLILRTIKINNNTARIQVGATLLSDSNPEEEEEETLTKAAALVQAIQQTKTDTKLEISRNTELLYGKGKQVLIIDHEDSFVNTIANYVKQLGANVQTYRYIYAKQLIESHQFDLVLLSPGPGKPSDYEMSAIIKLCIEKQIPIFGVCLGLQGLVEYFGGTLSYLPKPRHGKQFDILLQQPSILFKDFEDDLIQVGLYHSIYAQTVTNQLLVTAQTTDGIVMAIEHQDLPIWAVQFHPESVMTSRNQTGLKIIKNVLKQVLSKSAV